MWRVRQPGRCAGRRASTEDSVEEASARRSAPWSPTTESAPATQGDKHSAFEQLTSHESSADCGPGYVRSALEATPLTEYELDGEPIELESDLLAIGTVTGVEPVAGYAQPDGPDIQGEPSKTRRHDFDDPAASFGVVAIDMSVDTSTATDPALAEPDSARIGLTFPLPTDVDSLRSGLIGAKVAAILTVGGWAQLTEASDLLRAQGGCGGLLLGLVDDDEQHVTFPLSDLEQDIVVNAETGAGEPRRYPIAELLDPPPLVELQTLESGQIERVES